MSLKSTNGWNGTLSTNGAEKTRARRQSREDRTQKRQWRTEEKGWWTFMRLSSCRLSLSSSSRRDVLGLDLNAFCCRYWCLVRSASRVRWSHCRDRQTKTCALLGKMACSGSEPPIHAFALLAPSTFWDFCHGNEEVSHKHDATKRNAKYCYKV